RHLAAAAPDPRIGAPRRRGPPAGRLRGEGGAALRLHPRAGRQDLPCPGGDMRRALGLSLALAVPSALAAQGADEATFLIRHGRDEVGREQYRVLEGRGRGQAGSTVAVTAEYPARHPALSVTALVSRNPGGSLTAFQLERAGGGDTTR